MELFILYLILQLDAVVVVSTIALIFSAIAVVFLTLFGVISSDEDEDLSRGLLKWAKRAGIVAVVSVFMVTFTPSKSDAFILLGAWVGLEAVQSEEVREFSGKLYTYIDAELDQLLEQQEDE